ncbi:MAG: hypothetical protein KBB88_02535 [Candidatus Pacebacteria bacterium]|nr:hypothetical protein [Candidatus Paceibacterota bacterium]
MKKILSIFVVLALFVTSMTGLFAKSAMAASVTAFTATPTREKASTPSDYVIQFTTPTGVASGQTIILTFNNSTSIGASFDFTDMDLKDDGVDVTLAATPSAATWGAVRTSATVITFTNGTTAVTAASVINIELGLVATTGSTGDQQITQGSVGTTNLVISGTFGDSGTASIPIVDSDQVVITAAVSSTLTFDLDNTTAAGCGSTESAAPYTVSLGTVTTVDNRVSGNTDSINSICVDLASNAPGGASITVQNANGANGLVSASVPADKIPASGGTMALGTAKYGICIANLTDSGGNLDDEGLYDGDSCAVNTETNDVQVLSTTPGLIFDTDGAPVLGGRAQIIVQAGVASGTASHTDYTDTLTFIATASY